MTRSASTLAVPATLLLTLALLLPALPVQGEGLPEIRPGAPGIDCSRGEAGNSYEEAMYIGYDDISCTGLMTPVVDDQDWYAFWLPAGASFYASILGHLGDVDACLYGPSDNATPLVCSTEPLFVGDWLNWHAREWGAHRIQLSLVAGAATTYSLYLSSYEPPVFPLPDIALSDLRVEKPVLRTDALDTGVVNPAGAWKISVHMANLAWNWDCPEVRVYITGEPILPAFAFPPLGQFGPLAPGGYIEVGQFCVGPGYPEEISVDWRPLLVVGDVTITVVADNDWDENWENNVISTTDFVLVGGL